MGRHLALHLCFELEGRILFDGSQATRHIVPAALCAVSTKNEQEELFLAGFAVEGFLCRIMRANPSTVASSYIAQHPRSARRYLEQRVSELGPSFNRSQLSPFEAPHPQLPLTALREPGSLDQSDFLELAEWAAGRPNLSTYMLFAVDLATATGEWGRSLRALIPEPGRFEPAGIPFLSAHTTQSPFAPGVTELMIYSAAPVWLRGCRGFEGHITPACADENLRRLAELCRQFARSHEALVETELNLDGRDFCAEEARLREALEVEVARA